MHPQFYEWTEETVIPKDQWPLESNWQHFYIKLVHSSYTLNNY